MVRKKYRHFFHNRDARIQIEDEKIDEMLDLGEEKYTLKNLIR